MGPGLHGLGAGKRRKEEGVSPPHADYVDVN